MSGRKTRRFLALDPTTRGLSFAVLEGPDLLIDWGYKETRSDKYALAIKGVARLLQRYDPDLVLLEDCLSTATRRSWRIRDLVAAIAHLAREEGRQVRLISPESLLKPLELLPRATKHTLAQRVAERFPELLRSLPQKRKPWMSEDPRFSTFRAVAFCLAAAEVKDPIRRSKNTGLMV